jgi:hypothetical protein
LLALNEAANTVIKDTSTGQERGNDMKSIVALTITMVFAAPGVAFAGMQG